MRTSFITINSKKYILCMSNRVMTDIEAQGKSLQDFLSEENKTITNVCWLLRRMSEAGRAYAKMASLGDYDAITEDEILDASGSEDYEAYMAAIAEAASGQRNVDAEPPKNAEATRGEALVG